jgi:signal transduction histidine kinase
VRIEREAGALKRAAVNPQAILQEVASAHRKMAELKHVALELEDGEQNSQIELDPEQITIVLSNLVSNAIRHSREAGHVWLRAYTEGDNQVFAVRDNGDGIAPEQLPRIFERHWSGSEPSTLKGRHGLGLAIAKEIALRHDGTLDVESTLGKGSTFRLRVPRGAPGAESQTS